MNRIILFMFFLICTKVSTSQVTFTDLNNKWYVVKSFPDGNIQNPSFIATTTTLYANTGDSIINNETWTKIGSTQDSSLSLVNYNNLGMTKVYQNYILFIEQGATSIDTIYNFNINIGDSILYNFNSSLPTYLYLDSIDSTLINGFYHKVFYFNNVDFPLCCSVKEVWIEGIGSLHGPLFPFYPKILEIESYNEGNDLSCFTQDDISTWNHPDYNNCYINIVLNIDQNSLSKNILFYPNPTKGFLTIDIRHIYKNINIKITNIVGQEVLTKTFSNTNKIPINIQEQEDGIYFIHIQCGSINTVLKIIKK
ncbi:MAG: T9SS type A sorting domain-containing protein [Flavobacteriales bacterium]|nr:T9SS type A sorting domain-containing protein [Flavobacteriales bacterium]